MKVEYARRVVADLADISAYSLKLFGGPVSAALEKTILASIARIAATPEIGQRVTQRSNVRVLPLGRYTLQNLFRS